MSLIKAGQAYLENKKMLQTNLDNIEEGFRMAVQGQINQAQIAEPQLKDAYLSALRERLVVALVNVEDTESERKLLADLLSRGIPTFDAQEFYRSFAHHNKELFTTLTADAVLSLMTWTNHILRPFGVRIPEMQVTKEEAGVSLEQHARASVRATLGPAGIEPTQVLSAAFDTYLSSVVTTEEPIPVVVYNIHGASAEDYVGMGRFQHAFRYDYEKAPTLAEFLKTFRSSLLDSGLISREAIEQAAAQRAQSTSKTKSSKSKAVRADLADSSATESQQQESNQESNEDVQDDSQEGEEK